MAPRAFGLGLGLCLLLGCARSEPVASEAVAARTGLDRTHADTGTRGAWSGPPRRERRGDDRSERDPRPAPSPPTAPALSAAAEAWVAAHNLHRARVSPAASPALAPVTWSEELAGAAARWASGCEWAHSQGEFGENLSARTHAAAPGDIVASWASEAEHFDYGRNRCAAGEVCGHYTQVVWRDSTQIGCATVRCSGDGPFGGGAWNLSVCNYSPAGNWTGARPY